MQERFNEELNRRSQVIRIFPNIASCLRLVTAKAMEQNEEWAEQRPYVDIRELRAWEQAHANPVPVPSDSGQNTSHEPAYCRIFGT
jgi:transposase-like protein